MFVVLSLTIRPNRFITYHAKDEFDTCFPIKFVSLGKQFYFIFSISKKLSDHIRQLIGILQDNSYI